jgi:activator of HSP90 ATPase
MTKPILQEVVFENATSSDLYEMFLSSKHHSNFRGGIPADIQPVEGSNWNINNGHHNGKILKLVKDKLIVLSWRSAASLKEDETDMIVILHFIQSNENAIIEFTHTLIPDIQRYEIYFKNWNERYWTPWKDYINSLKNN